MTRDENFSEEMKIASLEGGSDVIPLYQPTVREIKVEQATNSEICRFYLLLLLLLCQLRDGIGRAVNFRI